MIAGGKRAEVWSYYRPAPCYMRCDCDRGFGAVALGLGAPVGEGPHKQAPSSKRLFRDNVCVCSLVPPSPRGVYRISRAVMAGGFVSVDRRPAGYAVLTMAGEPVNTLNLAAWRELDAALSSLEADPQVGRPMQYVRMLVVRRGPADGPWGCPQWLGAHARPSLQALLAGGLLLVTEQRQGSNALADTYLPLLPASAMRVGAQPLPLPR